MTIQQIETRLQRAGATDTEASDLAPILYQNGWFEVRASKPSVDMLANLGTLLCDWKVERSMIAADVRLERQATWNAGYKHALPVDAPVLLNGASRW